VQKSSCEEKMPSKSNYKKEMNKMNTVCGLDIAKEEVVATILGDSVKETRTFGVALTELSKLKSWLKEKGCSNAVMESTGVYWVPIYASLEEDGVQITLANARQVKAIPGKKTDVHDSEWLAYLLRSSLVKPSYIPDMQIRNLRSLTRLRATLKQDQAGYKNRVHKILQLCNIRLDSELADIFGKSGRIIINAIAEGASLDNALRRCPVSVRKNADAIKACVMGSLNQADLFQLKLCLGMVDEFEGKIADVDSQIARYVDVDAVEKLRSVPGVGDVSAATVIAELGDAKRFGGEKEVGCYAGMVPSVRQSGKRRWNGHITKTGSKWLRRVLVQCALAAIKVKGCRFREFYLRVKMRRGHGIAIVALARKMLGVMLHLLVSGEVYVEKELKPKRRRRLIKPRDLSVPFEEAWSLLVKAGFTSSA
jgi:transposase